MNRPVAPKDANGSRIHHGALEWLVPARDGATPPETTRQPVPLATHVGGAVRAGPRKPASRGSTDRLA